MKTKIFALIAAFFMLMGGSAWAQADVKGDVNGDGVVNEQDIAAILAIMQEAGGVKEKTKYYWYVGQENPANLDESFDPETQKVTDNTSPGWREIGTSIPTYDKTNPLWNQDKGKIAINDTKVIYYLALPSDKIKYRNDITGEDMMADAYKIINTAKNINGVNYIIYETLDPGKNFLDTLY